MLQLYDYQQEAVQDVRGEFRAKKPHVVLQSATGSGKTVMFTYMAKEAMCNGKKTIIFTHRTELLTQSGGTLSSFGINPYLIVAGTKYVNDSFSVYVAMAQTFRRRINEKSWVEWFLINIDLVIIDESHRQDFNFLFESGILDTKFVIGATATPHRSGKMRQLGLDYHSMVSTVPIMELIKRGKLLNCDYYDIEGADTSVIPIDAMSGDFMQSAMFKEFNSAVLYDGLLKNYKKHVDNTKSIVFCCNIEHAILTMLEFRKEGYNAKFVSASVSEPKYPKNPTEGTIAAYEDKLRTYTLYKEHYCGTREHTFRWLNETPQAILVNVDIATTGFDCPTLETVILNRATLSLSLYLQMVGRGSRIAPKVNKTHFNVLDLGGNRVRHGEYAEERIWHLWHEEKKGGGVPPVKECGYTNKGVAIKGEKKGCRRLILASYTLCPFCGFKYPEKKKKEVELVLTASEVQYKDEMTHTELYEYWKAKRYKPAWLWRKLWYEGGENNLKKFGKSYHWNYATINKAINFCKKLA